MNLKNIKQITKLVLSVDSLARNSDKHCYIEVATKLTGKNVRSMTLADWESDETIPSTESVRRTRQKVQSENPELASDKQIARYRKVMESEYRSFAREE